mgnify:CR=1 FL=1|jgi:hypothetical protein
MYITDRPGRMFAILVFAPTLFMCGLTVKKEFINVSRILLSLSFLLFFYELYCIFFIAEDILIVNY